MRRLVAGLFMSLDGVVESPFRWRLPIDAEAGALLGAAVARSDAILLGRRTYLEFAEFWPDKGSDVPLADFLNNSPKYVASSTLDNLRWAHSELLRGDLGEAIAELKRRPGKNIQVPGSPRLVRSLLRDGLLDELNLMIQPVVVGSGMRLFDEFAREVRLTLLTSTTLGNGVVSVTYQPERA